MKIRISKFLAQAGIASRRKSEELILAGKVKINKEIIKDLATKVEDNSSNIYFNNKLIKPEEKEYYFDNMDDYVYDEYFDDGPGEKEYYFGSILEYADVVYKLIPEDKSDTTLMTYFTEHHKNPLTEPKIITFIKLIDGIYF